MCKAVGKAGTPSGQTHRSRTGVQTRAWGRSGLIQKRATDQVDSQGAVVSGGTTKAREIGGGFVLAGGIQRAEADNHIAQGCQVLYRVAGADGGGIFAESNVAHVVDRFDAPMAPAARLDLRRGELAGGAAADNDFGVFGDLEVFEMMGSADNQRGLDGVREAALFGGDFKGPNLAGFMPAMALVNRDVRREKKRLSARRPVRPVCRRAWVDWL